MDLASPQLGIGSLKVVSVRRVEGLLSIREPAWEAHGGA
jgi:hypothetical protein